MRLLVSLVMSGMALLHFIAAISIGFIVFGAKYMERDQIYGSFGLIIGCFGVAFSLSEAYSMGRITGKWDAGEVESEQDGV